MIERFARTEFYIAGPIVRRSRQRFLFAAAPGNRSRKFQEEGVFTQPPDNAAADGHVTVDCAGSNIPLALMYARTRD